MAEEKILVVDDEDHIVELISYNLINSGYKVITANNGIDAVKLAKEENPRLMLLDLMIPGLDGYDVCKAIRSDNDTKDISVIMLTAKGEELDKILGLELGADDYMTKPFSIRELLARIKAVLRRTKSLGGSEEIFKTNGILINFERREVLISDKKIDLTLKEFELLEILVKNRGKILTRETLLDKIWGYEYVGETRTVDVHIRYLRKKIESSDSNEKYIETIRGIGYKIE